MNENYRAAKRTLRNDILDLVQWYDRFGKPEAGRRILVNAGPKAIAKAIGYIFETDAKNQPIVRKEIPYKGRTLVATGDD